MQDRTVEQLFAGEDIRYRVPIYQRHYVWNDTHWDHLWNDIEEKVDSVLKAIPILESKGLAATDADRPPPHFTGVIVTRTNPDGEIVIVDGQQRLTTFQIILCAIRDICKEIFPNTPVETKDERKIFVAVKGLVENPPHPTHENNSDKLYKLLPTEGPDRDAFRKLVISQNSDKGLLTDAYKWFKGKIKGYIRDENNGTVVNSYDKMHALSQAMLYYFKIVVMPLEGQPYKAAKVFESLNGRGLTLTQFDLLRNNVFLRAREEKNRLYEACWRDFNNNSLWLSEEVVDDFLQNFLEAKLEDCNLNRSLFDLYQRDYLVRLRRELNVDSGNEEEPTLVELEFEELQKYSKIYAEIANCSPESPMWFFQFIRGRKLQITSWHPLILFLKVELSLSDETERKIFRILESYIVRHLLCYPEIQGWERQRHFSKLIGELRKTFVSRNLSGIAQNILETLSKEKYNWPDDKQISEALITAYSHWSKTLILYILLKIEYENTKSKYKYDLLHSLSENNPKDNSKSVLTLEHVIPRGWENAVDHETGKRWWPIIETGEESHKKARKRDQLVHSIGNLTVLSEELNNEISQTEKFSKKKDVYEKYAKITHISLADDIIYDNDGYERREWDVKEIQERQEKLVNLFFKIWPSHGNCEV